MERVLFNTEYMRDNAYLLSFLLNYLLFFGNCFVLYKTIHYYDLFDNLFYKYKINNKKNLKLFIKLNKNKLDISNLHKRIEQLLNENDELFNDQIDNDKLNNNDNLNYNDKDKQYNYNDNDKIIINDDLLTNDENKNYITTSSFNKVSSFFSTK